MNFIKRKSSSVKVLMCVCTITILTFMFTASPAYALNSAPEDLLFPGCYTGIGGLGVIIALGALAVFKKTKRRK